MATINSINNTSNPLASTAITIDPGASGDSFVQFDINTTGEFRIGVDDTDDSYRISQGSALGTTDTFIMTAAGERTMPLNPAFGATLSAATSDDKTGDGTAYTVLCNTERYDQGADYDTSTGTFTAPVTGRYLLQMCIMVQNLGASHNLYQHRIVTSNVTYDSYYVKITGSGAGGFLAYNGSVVGDMDASDTVTFGVSVSGSTKTVGVNAGVFTFVSGCLVT